MANLGHKLISGQVSKESVPRRMTNLKRKREELKKAIKTTEKRHVASKRSKMLFFFLNIFSQSKLNTSGFLKFQTFEQVQETLRQVQQANGELQR